MENKKNLGKSVLILHRHALLSEGLARVIREAGFRVIQEIVNNADLTVPVLADKPDIVIIDCDIPDAENTVLRGVKECAPDAVLIMLTTPQPGHSFIPAINAGAQGYLSTSLSPDMFISLLHLLAGGNMVIAREKLIGDVDMVTGDHISTLEQLSNREKEVLSLVGKGATNREVAEELFMSEHTVKVHLRTILNKLNLRNRQQAAAYATQVGLVSDVSNNTRLHTGTGEPVPIRMGRNAVLHARN